MRTVTFNTNRNNFKNSNTRTSDGVTLTFNNIYDKYDYYLSLRDGTFTVTSTNKNIARVDINYYSDYWYTYDPQSVTADSGTFNDDYTDWRAHGNLVNSVTFDTEAEYYYYPRVSSIVVYLAN